MGVLRELIWLSYNSHVLLHGVLLIVRHALREYLLLLLVLVHLHLPIKMWRHELSLHLLGLHGHRILYLDHLLLGGSEGMRK
jgi:hypothetical protein